MGKWTIFSCVSSVSKDLATSYLKANLSERAQSLSAWKIAANWLAENKKPTDNCWRRLVEERCKGLSQKHWDQGRGDTDNSRYVIKNLHGKRWLNSILIKHRNVYKAVPTDKMGFLSFLGSDVTLASLALQLSSGPTGSKRAECFASCADLLLQCPWETLISKLSHRREKTTVKMPSVCITWWFKPNNPREEKDSLLKKGDGWMVMWHGTHFTRSDAHLEALFPCVNQPLLPFY